MRALFLFAFHLGLAEFGRLTALFEIPFAQFDLLGRLHPSERIELRQIPGPCREDGESEKSDAEAASCAKRHDVDGGDLRCFVFGLFGNDFGKLTRRLLEQCGR